MPSKDEPPPQAEPDIPRWPDGTPKFGVRLDIDLAYLHMARGEPYDEALLWGHKTKPKNTKAS